MAAKGASADNAGDGRGLDDTALLNDAAVAVAIGPADVLLLDSDIATAAQDAEGVLLQLDDLLPDSSGEVVLFAESEVPVNLIADVALADSGIAEAHITAAGLDVTGLHFYSFESGITIYSPSDLLILDSGAA